jgi:hypothetical protein
MRFVLDWITAVGMDCLGFRNVGDASDTVTHLSSVVAKSRLSLFFLSCLLMTTSTQSAVVTYTLSGGKIDGSLKGLPFLGKSFTITIDAAPANFKTTNKGSYILYEQLASPTMTIDGLAPFVITEPLYKLGLVEHAEVFSGPLGSWGGGFGKTELNDFFAIVGVPTGDLFDGPGSITALLRVTLSLYQTSAGALNITRNSPGSTTFTVSSSASVPEPTSMAIFGLGALGLTFLARRKSRL